MRRRKAGSVYFSCFAALLLIAQLVIAGGHVHLAGSHDDYAQTSAPAAPDGGGGHPGKPQSDHDAFCPLCWAHGVAASMLAPAAALLQHPLSAAASPAIPLSARPDGFPSSSAFNPRAPPPGVTGPVALS